MSDYVNNYKINDIKHAVANNEPIEEKLNVIVVVSNPCLYARRYILLKEFMKRIEEEEVNVNLFVVEMIYQNQSFIITDENNKRHLQLKTETPLWHKENMVNLAVKYLLPSDYKAFAWVDADIEFENNSWALDTLKILNGCKEVVQLFSHCVDMNKDQDGSLVNSGFGYNYNKNNKYSMVGVDYWHPGYAWAITRKAYEEIGGLYDKGILGAGDYIMALCFINGCTLMTNPNYSDDYNNSMLEFQVKAGKLKLGYVMGVIRHHYHGLRKNRQYSERWKILMRHKYSPIEHVMYDKQGIIIPTKRFWQELKDDIMIYFSDRKEDE